MAFIARTPLHPTIVTWFLAAAAPLTGWAEEGRPKSDAPLLPAVPVEAPRIATSSPSASTAAEPTPSAAETLAERIFDFAGSPLNEFNASTRSVTGAPVDVFQIPNSTSILGQERIQQRQAAATPELLEGLPGVFIQRTNQGGGSLIIRGRNGNQNIILVDGIPVNDAGWRFGNVQYLNIVDPGTIDRIEVLRGPNSVLYGSGAEGGVLNIVTKRRSDYSNQIGANGGVITNYGTAANDIYTRGEFTGNYGDLGISGGVSYLGVGDVHVGQGITFENTGYDQTAANGRIDYLIGDGWVFTYNYQHFFQNAVPRTDRFPSRPTYFDPQQRNFMYWRVANDDLDSPYISGIETAFSLQQRKEGNLETDLTRRPPRITNDYIKIWYWTAETRAYTRLSDSNTLSYGIYYSADTVDASRLRGNVGSQLQPVDPILPNDGTYRQFGFYMMDRVELTDWLWLTAGIRYSYMNAMGTNGEDVFFDRNFDVWTTEYGAVVPLTDTLHLTGRIAQGFRAPNLDDLGSSDVPTSAGQDFGTPNLKTESVWSYEAGVKKYGETFQGSATVYQADYFDLIARDIVSGRNVRANFDGVIRGAEVDGNVFLTENWSLYGQYTYLWGENYSLNEPLRVPPAYYVAGSRWAIPRYNAFFEAWGEFAGSQTRLGRVDRNDVRVPPGGESAWQTANLRSGIDMQRWGELTLGLYNIFDQNYRLLGSGVDAPGIDFRIGYILSF